MKTKATAPGKAVNSRKQIESKKAGNRRAGLKMIHAVTAVAPRPRRSRFLILKSGLALRACALGLGLSGAAHQLDITNGSVRAEMSGDREIIDSANGG